jgi:Protein of unknown function (DUF3732).
MKFVLHEIKLWFKKEDSEPKSYFFLPDKVNVITGGSSTGKTSFWSIIDYCLLSGRIKIADAINDKVLWFGIRFTLNGKEVSIVRKTPSEGAVSSEVFFDYGTFPNKLESNKPIAEIKAILDTEFGITDNLRFPFGKEFGETPFNLSYRHFLLFNALTENVIGTEETYFDTVFFKQEYDNNALSHIFDLVIGVNDMENIKAKERLQVIDNELRKIKQQDVANQNKVKNFEKDIFSLITKCKQNNFLEFSEQIERVDDAIIIIKNIISNTIKLAENTKLFEELDELAKKRSEIQSQINTIARYQKEFDQYKRNLNKSADSLQPIEFLNTNLSDQLVDSYETTQFLSSLESSLRNIKENLSKKAVEPLKINGDIKALKVEIDNIDKRIEELKKVKTNYDKESQKFMLIGEIKNAFEQIFNRKEIKPIDNVKLNELNDEKLLLEKKPVETKDIKYLMKTKLDESIQRNYNQLKSLPTYKTRFNENEMLLKLYPQGQIFPLDTVGSKSNYMFMHLCVYLGLHEHIMNLQQENVPPFLFIDQPSIPYYTGDSSSENDDKNKLIDAFSLINSFIDYIVETQQGNFQIFVVEHAPKEYWIENNLKHFHTVDEFINGNGLIPSDIYNS